jgi:hypothetical protein
MEELEMFNFLEDEFHVIRTIGLSSKTLENIVSNEVHSRSCVDDCKRLYVVCCGKPLAEANGVPSLWLSIISTLETTCS